MQWIADHSPRTRAFAAYQDSLQEGPRNPTTTNSQAAATHAEVAPAPNVVQRVLIQPATVHNLRESLSSDEAREMVDRISYWPDSEQRRLLLKPGTEDLRAIPELNQDLTILRKVQLKLPSTPNYRAYFRAAVRSNPTATGRDLVQSTLRALLGLIPDGDKKAFGTAVGNQATWNTVVEKIPENLGEEHLAPALQADVKKLKNNLISLGNTKSEKESARSKAEILHPIVETPVKELDALLADNETESDTDALKRRKENLKRAQNTLQERTREWRMAVRNQKPDSEVKTLEKDQKFWIQSVKDWQAWVEKSETSLASKNRNLLANLKDGAGSLSPRLKTFLESYSVNEVVESSNAPVTDVPGAVVNTAPNTFTRKPPDDPTTAGYTVNIMTVASGDDTTPGKIAAQYYDEAFDDSDFGPQGKKAGIPYRMSMVVGVNLYQSIEPDMAEKQVARYVRRGGQEDRYPMAAFGFVWSPVWKSGGKEKSTTDLQADFSKLNSAEQKVALEYEQKSVRSKIQAHIPYGRLRNRVRESTYTHDQLAFLGRHNKVAYIQSGDDDSPSLRPHGTEIEGSKGVLSRYDKVLAQLGRHPLLVVGGYRFDLGKASRKLNESDPGDFLTYLADVLNQAVRKALGQGLAVYPTEPNLLIKAYEKGKPLALPKDLWGVGAAEGRHMRKNLLTGLNVKGPEEIGKSVVFDPRAAVATDPTRFKLGNDIRLPEKHYAMQDAQKYPNFEAMRLSRGGKDRRLFMAQLLADVVLQNQSMSDRRVFAREVGDMLRLQNLDGGEASILADAKVGKRELVDSELLAVMIHNQTIQQKIFELSGIGKKKEGMQPTEYDDFLKRMRFDIGREEPIEKLTGTAPDSDELTQKQKLKPEMANQVNAIVKSVVDELEQLKVDGQDFWPKLQQTMDRLYTLIPQDRKQ